MLKLRDGRAVKRQEPRALLRVSRIGRRRLLGRSLHRHECADGTQREEQREYDRTRCGSRANKVRVSAQVHHAVCVASF
jgi:hypothetical protein